MIASDILSFLNNFGIIRNICIFESCWFAGRWIGVAEQAVVIAWVIVVRSDVDRDHASATVLYPLARVFFKAKVSAKDFNY